MDYLLTNALTEGDVDFLNATPMEFELVNSNGRSTKLSPHDSGWCDMASGIRIIGPGDRVRFINPTEQDLTFLLLRYQDRLKKIVPTNK